MRVDVSQSHAGPVAYPDAEVCVAAFVAGTGMDELTERDDGASLDGVDADGASEVSANGAAASSASGAVAGTMISVVP